MHYRNSLRDPKAPRPWRDVGLILLAVVLLGCIWLLTGCGGREPANQGEAARASMVAEADSGAQAAKLTLGAAMTPQVADILDGSAAFARAAAGDLAIPAAAWSPQRIVAAPADYRRAGEAAERKANGSQIWFWLKVVGGCAVPVLLALAKNLPGAGGLIGGAAELLWKAYTPKATKQEDEARTTLASHTSSVLEIASLALPPGEAHRMARQLPPEVVAAAQQLGIGLPTAPTLADVPPPRPTGAT